MLAIISTSGVPKFGGSRVFATTHNICLKGVSVYPGALCRAFELLQPAASALCRSFELLQGYSSSIC